MIRAFFLLKAIPIFVALFSFSLYGKMFKSSYVRFDIGYDWTCRPFGVDWVCHHFLQKGAKPALMLITAKEGAGSDAVNLYIQAFDQGPGAFSKKIHVRKILVNRQAWIESFYQNNTLQNTFDRHVATVCCNKMQNKIHVLIGFHAHQENYTKYAREFLKSIKSLQLSKNLKEALEQIRKQTKRQQQDMLSYIERILLEADLEKDTAVQKNKGGWTRLASLLFIGFILTLFFAFLYYKKTKAKKRKRRRKRKRKDIS